mmetsp:Transcript_19344/g.28631  ORF Transcript_19344/g.28631 Transcript_19344/m.28631 type:complete len:270 (-) Transcript_19344:51-860(-)
MVSKRKQRSSLSDSLRAEDTTPIDETMRKRWRYLKTNYPELLEKRKLKSWAWMYLEMGHKDMATNLQSYYGNISIVAALAAGFSISGVLAPGFDVDNQNDFLVHLIGINAAILVCLLFACVLDCIMIENSLRLVSDEKYMLEFIKTEGAFLKLPLLLFIVGLGSTLVNIAVALWIIYGDVTGMISSACLVVTALGLLRRYLLTSRKLLDYATLGLEDMATAADDQARFCSKRNLTVTAEEVATDPRSSLSMDRSPSTVLNSSKMGGFDI